MLEDQGQIQAQVLVVAVAGEAAGLVRPAYLAHAQVVPGADVDDAEVQLGAPGQAVVELLEGIRVQVVLALARAAVDRKLILAHVGIKQIRGIGACMQTDKGQRAHPEQHRHLHIVQVQRAGAFAEEAVRIAELGALVHEQYLRLDAEDGTERLTHEHTGHEADFGVVVVQPVVEVQVAHVHATLHPEVEVHVAFVVDLGMGRVCKKQGQCEHTKTFLQSREEGFHTVLG